MSELHQTIRESHGLIIEHCAMMDQLSAKIESGLAAADEFNAAFDPPTISMMQMLEPSYAAVLIRAAKASERLAVACRAYRKELVKRQNLPE